MEVFVWLILVAIVFIISKGVFAINFGTATLTARVATQTARVSVSAALILAWLFTWKKIADYYLTRMMSRQSSA